MQDEIRKLVKKVLDNLNIKDSNFSVEHPEDFKHGDYSTNVALVAFTSIAQNGKAKIWSSTRELAEKIKKELEKNLPAEIQEIQVAGAGFINFHLSRKFFCGKVEEILNNPDFGKNNSLKDKKIMVEYTDPNPFKPFHIGHLMTNAIGESVASILEYANAEVLRANYQGDVGLHVARAIYGLLKNKDLQDRSGDHTAQAGRIGEAYVFGAEKYEADSSAKAEIDAINKKIYSRTDEEINEIYDWGFKATMKAFEDLYKILGTKFDFYFLESQVASVGADVVRENTGKVFTESDGATIFKAEEHDPKLHTRVFLTSEGLPTYEAKELGLTLEKFKTQKDLNLSLVVTANEQADFMKVVIKALSFIHPEYTDKMRHISHGMMRLASGKMSSRKGNVVTGEQLLKDTIALVGERLVDRDLGPEEGSKIATMVGVAAIKYSILKQGMGGNIMYDFEKSISFEGDSGPYLQYTYARASSVLKKAQAENIAHDPHTETAPEEVFEVERLLYRFPEVVARAGKEYEPHYVANYLIELARSYNSFYGSQTILDKEDKTSAYKLALTYAFSFVMKRGLHLLGIEAPERM